MRGRKKDLVIKQKREYMTIDGKLPLPKKKKKKAYTQKITKENPISRSWLVEGPSWNQQPWSGHYQPWT